MLVVKPIRHQPDGARANDHCVVGKHSECGDRVYWKKSRSGARETGSAIPMSSAALDACFNAISESAGDSTCFKIALRRLSTTTSFPENHEASP
jgi:hypothetical protein